MGEQGWKKYADIIDLPHHTSKTRPRMPVETRAAIFSPFAALTGYDAAVKETARLTEDKIELDEYERSKLDVRLQIIRERMDQHPEIIITYFQPDLRKEGGEYQTITGRIKKIDEYEGVFVMQDGSRIFIGDILELQGEVFREFL